MDTVVGWSEAERIIDVEVRRFVGRGSLPGYDRDDLRQECRIVVAKALGRIQRKSGTGATYVRASCRNRLTNLLRQSTTAGRCPHDAWGRPSPGMLVPIIGPNGHDMAEDRESIEKVVATRQALRYLQTTLDPRDWQSLQETFVSGALALESEKTDAVEAARAKACSILSRIGYRATRESEEGEMSIPDTPVEDLPSCHALGAKPQGYAADDRECQQCPDKFTCLPSAIERKLVTLRLSADREVEAVVEGRLEYMGAISRMKRRVERMKAGEDVPPEERCDWEGLADGSKAAAAAAPAPAPAPAPQADASVKRTKKPKAEKAEKPKKPAKDANVNPGGYPGGSDEVASLESAIGRPMPTAKAEKPAKPAEKPAKVEEPAEEPVKAPLVLSAKAHDAKHADVYVGAKHVARVERTREGWGWFAANGSGESDEWLSTWAAVIADLQMRIAKEAGREVTLDAGALTDPSGLAKKAKTEGDAAESRAVPDYWPRMRDGRPYPSPRALTEEEMVEKLAEAQAKLGANIELDYGMQIVRRTRAGDVVAVVRPNGFEYTIPDPKLVKEARLDSPTQLFGSLSSVAMWGEGRLRTGNDFFNLAKHNCTEVRSADNRIIDRRGGVPG